MQFDLAKDIIVVYGWALSLSTAMIWGSALLAFAINFIYNRRVYMQQYREGKINEIAKAAFVAAEKVAKLTPMESDDKLLFFVKRSIRAYQEVFRRMPSEADLKMLREKAEELADADKLETLKFKAIQEETTIKVTSAPTVISEKPVIEAEPVIVSKKPVKKPVKKPIAKVSKGRK